MEGRLCRFICVLEGWRIGNSVVSGWNGLRGYALTQNRQKHSLDKRQEHFVGAESLVQSRPRRNARNLWSLKFFAYCPPSKYEVVLEQRQRNAALVTF